MYKLEKKILVTGHFNVLHPGHIRLLKFAKSLGGYLIVAVESNNIAGQSAYVTEDLRLEAIQNISFVNEAFIFNESVESLIHRLKPDFVVKGKEHEYKQNVEELALRSYGGSLIFSSGDNLFSTSDLIKNELRETEYSTIRLPIDFMNRNKINKNHLIKITESFRNLKVLVVGDLIVDEYISCQPLGMSQEDPTIVVAPIDSVKFVGGAGIVAAHAVGMGADVTFISIIGNDKIGRFCVENFRNYSVNATLFVDQTRPTTLKQRFRSKGKSLLRVSYLHQGAVSISLQKKILSKFKEASKDVDLIVFSDFNYGCLPQSLLDKLIIQSKKNSKAVLVADSQSSSQTGDISRFKGMDLITPTEREARISSRNREDGLVVLAEQLRQFSNARNVFLKMGEEGLLVHAHDTSSSNFLTDQVEALNSNPKDVAGAGDSLLITSGMALAAGANIWEASCLGSIAAAIQVSRIGNIPLVINELLMELRL